MLQVLWGGSGNIGTVKQSKGFSVNFLTPVVKMKELELVVYCVHYPKHNLKPKTFHFWQYSIC